MELHEMTNNRNRGVIEHRVEVDYVELFVWHVVRRRNHEVGRNRAVVDRMYDEVHA
jgi:hypothetical protein